MRKLFTTLAILFLLPAGAAMAMTASDTGKDKEKKEEKKEVKKEEKKEGDKEKGHKPVEIVTYLFAWSPVMR